MEMKRAICIVFAVLVLLSANTIPGFADDGGRHHGGGTHFRGSIWIGPEWGGWGPWWWPPYYPNYPYYSEPPVVIQQQPPAYVEPTPEPEEQYYWYFCQNPQGYYPYVKKCPSGWLKVIPPVPPDEEE
jgi:hypothetical protein